MEDILKIYEQGSKALKEDKVDQWQKGGPSKKTLIEDIEMENSYVYEENGTIKGTTALIFEGEKTYNLIFNGNWLNEDDYSTIHRFAVSKDFKKEGIATKMLLEIESLTKQKGFYNIRVDTHEDNFKMRNLLEKNGYQYCGKIFLTSGDLRVAYQKILY